MNHIMKKIAAFILISLSLISCNKEVEFNNPGFQGVISSVTWNATTQTAVRNASGGLILTGFGPTGSLVLNTSSTAVGTYKLGTTNQLNNASFSPESNSSIKYTTGITSAPAYEILLTAGGTGYTTSSIVATTGGSGSGLKLNCIANASGVITSVAVNNPGDNYKAGDIVTISGGNADAKVLIQNVLYSNGEIKITENTGATISGSFKFVAFDELTDQITSCRDGFFYKIPLN